MAKNTKNIEDFIQYIKPTLRPNRDVSFNYTTIGSAGVPFKFRQRELVSLISNLRKAKVNVVSNSDTIGKKAEVMTSHDIAMLTLRHNNMLSLIEQTFADRSELLSQSEAALEVVKGLIRTAEDDDAFITELRGNYISFYRELARRNSKANETSPESDIGGDEDED